SWLTPSGLLAAQDWNAITRLAREAVDHVLAFRAKS
ncbi:MAG: 2-dehydro-3-deoxyphosphogluconate aldolase/(4S)-4-hydroxy-2-oxoglutarate aldolase, partial [Congregibacter sp.]